MQPSNVHDTHARLKALRHDPGFRLIRPALISTRALHNLNPAIKPVPAIRHLLLKRQNETRGSINAMEPQRSMGGEGAYLVVGFWLA